MGEFEHEAVKHSAHEYMEEQGRRNGIESFWRMLKRGYYGIYHRISVKHLVKYVEEFVHCHNIREQDTIEQMENLVSWMPGKHLQYRDLIGDHSLAICTLA